jgi:hypothetical protein
MDIPLYLRIRHLLFVLLHQIYLQNNHLNLIKFSIKLYTTNSNKKYLNIKFLFYFIRLL